MRRNSDMYMRNTNIIFTMRRIVLVLLSLIVATLSAQNIGGTSFAMSERKGNGIYPSWVGDVACNNLWLGVSPPMHDKNTARNLAVQNAVLYYICANGGAYLSVDYFLNTESIEHFGENNNVVMREQTYTSTENVGLKFDGFSVRVINEYHNKRGECFVACEVNMDSDSPNKMILTRAWEEKRNGNVRCEMLSDINKVPMQSSVNVEYNGDAVTYSYSVDFKEEVLERLYNYPRSSFAAISDEYGYKFTIEQSLGVAQMVCLAMSPFVADKVAAQRNIFWEKTASKEEFKTITQVAAKGIHQGLGITFYGVDKQELSVAVKDQSEEINSWDWNDKERFLIGEGFAEQNNIPLGLERVKAYYDALCDMASKKSMNMHTSSNVIQEAEDTKEESVSMSRGVFENCCIDWGYHTDAPFVLVRVGLDNQAAIGERIQDALNDVK
ncbi:MAG: hypothetical protein IKT86_05780 [Bacteroidaceae bacterium]|nr:hypothetical protein [Bacteroidaceae bacterium]